MRKVIVLSGPIAAGKSSFADALAQRFSATRISTRKYILAHTDTPSERGALQAAGDKLDIDTGGAWVSEAVAEQGKGASESAILLVDSARIEPQIVKLRKRFGKDVVLHIHLTAPDVVLAHRYMMRPRELREFDSYDEVRNSLTEAAVWQLAPIADVVVDTSTMEPPSQVTYATAGRIDGAPVPEKLVDVYVGAQWGSEGKGNICAYMAREYDVLVRVGGPNAGHKVADPAYKYVQLPSGTGRNRAAKVLIAAGSTIWLPTILKEIQDHPWLTKDQNLVIDYQAMIIEKFDQDIEAETLETIASTKQGVGAATARKIAGRGGKPPFGPTVKLARDEASLKPYLGDTKRELERAYATGKYVMLEGTQGTDLSIHHGFYPKVTSRETTSSGCLSDAGIGHHRVRRVVLVTRTYPIRVGGDSGPMGIEISFKDVADRSGLSLEMITETEVGSVSGRKRRIAEFDWEQLRRSVELNGATDIAITFADYIDKKNQTATDYNSLTDATRIFVETVERVASRPVTLISKGFGPKEVIDRRKR